MKKLKIALIEQMGQDFNNLRLPLAKYLKNLGHEVYAVIPDDGYNYKIEENGITVLNYSIKRNQLNPVSLTRQVRQLRGFNKEISFDIVHSFRLQPNVISLIAFYRKRKILKIAHITGLGFSFTKLSWKSVFYRFIVLSLYQTLLPIPDKVIVQNKADFKILTRLLFLNSKLAIINGSGIDLEEFCSDKVGLSIKENLLSEIGASPEDLVILFSGRLLKEKGIVEFLTAANNLTKRYLNLKFIVAGRFDKSNPTCISEAEFSDLTQNPSIFYLGERSDIRELLSITDIFVLPTYREGFSRSILEAMAMEVPVVTTKVPGAQDAVRENYNGLLADVENLKEIETAVEELINNKKLRLEFGKNGRALAKQYYSSDVIFGEISGIYLQLLEKKKGE
jgi:N,N'-diacetylbacillosaminyl-diphospho-undecaprenol alpha-1,3-N-acetylgalactosaminyltransferase